MYFRGWNLVPFTHNSFSTARLRYTRSTSNSLNTTIFPNSTSPNHHAIDSCSIENIDDSAESIALCVFFVLILIASVAGNSLVIAATWLSKQLRNRVTVYFIVSLACSDMLNAITQTPFNISFKLHQRFCHTLGSCYVWLLGDAIATSASILNLFFIAVDRYIAIRFPFSHSTLLSTRRVRRIITGIWCFVVVWVFAGVFKWDSKEIDGSSTVFSISATRNQCSNKNKYFYVAAFLGIYIVPLAIMSFTYFMILQIAISQIRAIESTQVNVSSRLEAEQGSTEAQEKNNNITLNKKRREKRLKRKELKATKSVAIVYLAFVICYLPSCIISIIILFAERHFPKLQKSNMSLFLFIYYFFILVLPRIGTMINPIIYSFSNNQFRRGFRSVYNRLLGKFDSIDNSSSDDHERNATRLRGVSLATVASPVSSVSSPVRYPQIHTKQYSISHSMDSGHRNPGFRNSLTSVDKNNFNAEPSYKDEVLWKPD